VTDYEYNNWGTPDYPDAGVEFKYLDYEGYIDMSSAPDSNIIKGGYPVIFWEGDLLLNDKYIGMTNDILRGNE